MSSSPKAVFLSYASQDAEAARRICDALRAMSVDVWFDQSALRGGDAWDASIRRQIKDCALFVPVISANTQAREEGYFRLEWKLAVDRSHLMVDDKAFLLPVVIDATLDVNARVPEKFREVQWTHLPSGEAPTVFAAHVHRLLAAGPLPVAAPRVAAAAARTVTAPIDEPPSIAVLPFVNMSRDEDDEYFADGLAEELLNVLSKIRGLRVAARSSAFTFKGKGKSVAEVGRALNVATVLEGSVRKAGNRLRISVQLVKVADGYHLWSERYDRTLEDIFAVQDEIAHSVVQELRTTLTSASQESLGAVRVDELKRPTANVDAYNLYLKGRFFWNQRPRVSDKALQYLYEAIELEPAFALAHAGLADAYNTLGAWEASVLPPLEAFPKAHAAAVKALEFDPHLAEAHAALGYASTHYLWDWVAAEKQFRHALALKTNYGHAHHWLSHLLMARGRIDESLASSVQALECDPLDLVINIHLAWHYWFARQYDQALEQCERTVELDPNEQFAPMFSGFAHIERGDAAAAIAAHRVALKRSNGSPVILGALGYSYAAGGERKLAHGVLKRLQERGTSRGMYGYEMGIIHGALGDVERAFDCLNRAYRERSTWLAYLRVDPRLDRLRGDKRFDALLRSLDLDQTQAPAPAMTQHCVRR